MLTFCYWGMGEGEEQNEELKEGADRMKFKSLIAYRIGPTNTRENMEAHTQSTFVYTVNKVFLHAYCVRHKHAIGRESV